MLPAEAAALVGSCLSAQLAMNMADDDSSSCAEINQASSTFLKTRPT